MYLLDLNKEEILEAKHQTWLTSNFLSSPFTFLALLSSPTFLLKWKPLLVPSVILSDLLLASFPGTFSRLHIKNRSCLLVTSFPRDFREGFRLCCLQHTELMSGLRAFPAQLQCPLATKGLLSLHDPELETSLISAEPNCWENFLSREGGD